MVKKLFKHEFIAYMRALLPMHLIMLGVAALTRFVYIFENDSTSFMIVGRSSIVALVISCIVCLVLSYANIVTRFYKNMFTHEGYLSFTLPVTNAQHILVKVTTGVAVLISSLIAIVLAVCIATAGEFTVELFKAGFWILGKGEEQIGWQFWLYMIEAIITVVAAMFTSILLFYSCITIGQLSNKNRIILAIGVYFIYYFITQVISTVFIVVMSVVSYQDWFIKIMDNLGLFVESHPYVSGHLFFLILFVGVALMGLIYFLITHTIMKKKLNLE